MRKARPHTEMTIEVAKQYFLALILVVATVHIVNNLSVPTSLAGVKSYSLRSGLHTLLLAMG